MQTRQPENIQMCFQAAQHLRPRFCSARQPETFAKPKTKQEMVNSPSFPRSKRSLHGVECVALPRTLFAHAQPEAACVPVAHTLNADNPFRLPIVCAIRQPEMRLGGVKTVVAF